MLAKVKILLGIAFIGVMIIFLLYSGKIRFNYPSFEEFPVQGLDISHHQGKINWEQLSKQNYKFIYIKATEGGDFKDPKFKNNWLNSHKNFFLTGAYHFFTLCKPGLEQAINYIATVPSSSPMLPPAIDLEFGGNCSNRPSKKELLMEIKSFANEIKKAYQQEPILYVTSDFYKAYLEGANLPYKLWVRNIYKKPSIPSKDSWLFWQYANRGHVEGIKTFVDINVFNGELIDLQYLLKTYPN